METVRNFDITYAARREGCGYYFNNFMTSNSIKK